MAENSGRSKEVDVQYISSICREISGEHQSGDSGQGWSRGAVIGGTTPVKGMCWWRMSLGVEQDHLGTGTAASLGCSFSRVSAPLIFCLQM